MSEQELLEIRARLHASLDQSEAIRAEREEQSRREAGTIYRYRNDGQAWDHLAAIARRRFEQRLPSALKAESRMVGAKPRRGRNSFAFDVDDLYREE